MADESVPQKRAYDTLDETTTLEAVTAAIDPALDGVAPAAEPSASANTEQVAAIAERNKVKRTRIRQACDRCKSRKTKCNNQRPCAACVAAGTECHDWRPGMEAFATQGLSQASLEHLSFELAGQPASLNDLEPLFPGTAPTTSTGTAWPLAPAAERDRRPPYPYETLFRNEDGGNEHASASSGMSQLVYLGRRVGRAAEGPEDWTVPPVKYDEMYENERGSDMEREGDHDYHAMADVHGGWKVIIMLVRPFLDTTQVLWPSFHVPTFLSSLVSVKVDQDPVFICLVLSIAFMSLRERRTRKDVTEETGVGLYYTYWNIRRAAPNRDWSSPTAIQGMVFLAVGCSFMASVRGATAARTLIGEAVSKVFDSGLHRRQSVADMPTDVSEARKRTLWLVYCVDKSIAVTGRPAMLRLSDIDQDEISISDSMLSERLSSEAPSLLAYHRTAIRLYMILERVVAKINMPACTGSSAINAISKTGGARRYRESERHYHVCDSDHKNTGFEDEIQLLDTYQYSDIPLPSRAIEEDAMYQSHLARIRSLSSFCRLLIASHLSGVANSDLTEGSDSNVRHAPEVLQWSQELLRSQTPILEKGSFPDFGPTCVTQIAQVAKALLPIIHLIQTTNQLSLPIVEYLATFQTAIELLRGLRPKLDLVVRYLGPLEQYAEKLGVALPPQRTPATASINDKAPAQSSTSDGLEQQPGQTSGSGAIQALLSLSGQAKGEETAPPPGVDQGQGDVQELDAWWASILSGTIGE